MSHNINKIDKSGAPHKEEFHLWAVENPYMPGQDISILVTSLKTGANSNHLLKNIGMTHNMAIHNSILNNHLHPNIGMHRNNNSCLLYQHLCSHQVCSRVHSPLQAWAPMSKELDRVSPHKRHRCNMARQQVDNSHQWGLNHRRKGNHHLIVNSTHLQVDTLDKVISEHFIHFTEGECSDTRETVSPMDI